jgi:NAD+ synthase
MDKIETHITHWLNDYLVHSKTSGFVIGVSGGIDSAVTSTLAAKTGQNVLCLEMPIHQETKQDNRASKHIEWLKKQFKNVTSHRSDLSTIYDTFKKKFEAQENEENYAISMVNSRARLRMTTLYFFAQINNSLVVGTGNKVEDFGIGFFTKYGDGGVDLSPIADLNKTEVYELGKHLNIIEEILTAAPTDGLWEDGRTDEDQIGATYSELEWAMEYKGNANDLISRKSEILKIYNQLHNANKHKMVPIPVCNIPINLK